MSTTIEVDGVSKRYSGMVAVDDVSFSVNPHEFVSIVGPSGCGKSTLLRIVAGLVEASAGKVTLDGRESRLSKHSDIGMVFQAPTLLPWRRALDNILFMAEMRGEKVGKYRDRAMELIELANLKGFEKSYPFELSGGMQQRVSICRALLLNPSLILMDEPFGALDVITRERLGFELQSIWLSSRNTVLLVTHGISEAVLLSDRIIVMGAHPGHIRDIVTVDLPRPRNTETLRDLRFVELSAAVREMIETH